MKPQCATVLRFLRKRPMTTGAIRQQCGVSTVSATIHDLRDLGCKIATELVRVPTRHGGATVAKYELKHAPKKLLRRAA